MNESLIKTLNNIQHVLAQYKLNNTLEIPQIIVIGCQSVGKSSLLEQLIGKEFLPKGEGIVTRTPIMIQVVHNDKIKGIQARIDGETEVHEDFQALRAQIGMKTDKLAGGYKNISHTPIVIKIEGDEVCTLNYIDLPGLTKIPVNGQYVN